MARSDEVTSLVHGLSTGQLSRRDFVRRAAALGISSSMIGAALAACGAEATPTAAPTARAAPIMEEEMPSAAPGGAAASPVVAGTPGGNTRTGITAAEWNPESIRANAGTLKVDTKAEVAKLTPLDYKGKLSFWYSGPDASTPKVSVDKFNEFWAAWKETYPGIPLNDGDNLQNISYAELLDKLRTATAGGAGPDMLRLQILGGVEFAAKGYLQEINLADFGYKPENFWSGALKSCTWNNKIYGVPTNNETMAFIWNKKVFERAGLDPNKAPATWADVVSYSKAIKDKTGKWGFGMVARVNHGNTPFRFMPILWAYGSGALDEAEPNPTYQKVLINNEGGVAALQAYYDMYVRDKSVPTSALTNSQAENQDLFISQQIAMVIAHPAEYAVMQDKLAKATGQDKAVAQETVDNMAYGLMPEGPVRRAVVFGGSNMHILTDKAAGRTVDRKAANAFMAFACGPEWSTRHGWTWQGSNPGHLDGFKTEWMKQRIEQIKFLEYTTAMLPYGVPFPVIPESTQIMNFIVPEMLQNALTQKMTVKQAADDAAEKIKKLIAERKP
jgi:multiple sugar transport system substrate-binding protein